MTNAELNARIDELLGNDQSQKMCMDEPDEIEVCHEEIDAADCMHLDSGGCWEDCDRKSTYHTPDYCGDGAAFLKLVEWIKHNEYHCEWYTDVAYNWCVAVTSPDCREGFGANKDLAPALARAVYEAMKGT